MKRSSTIYLILLMLVCSFGFSQPINHALTATATQSGGGVTIYGPANYNDNVITAGGGLPWGWVSTGGSIEYTWNSSVPINAVVFEKDNRPMTVCTIEYWDGAAYQTILNYTGPATLYDSVSFPTVFTTRLRFSNVSGSSNPNHREIKALFNSSFPDDAGVVALDSPFVFCSGAQNIVARIANNGTNQITSVDVHWSIGGVPQPTYSFSGLLDTINGTGSTTAQVLLGSYTFPNGLTNIEVYTANPNRTADTTNYNDTLRTQKGPSLNGNYTLNPALVTGGVNFNNFTDLETALNTFGVCGPVNVTVSSGNYPTNVAFGNIAGASSTNTITIDGIDSSLVTINGTGNFYTIALDGASYFTIKNMSIINANTTTFAVLFGPGAQYNTVSNCEIAVNVASTSSLVNPIGASASLSGRTNGPANVNYNVIENNRIIGGYYGAYFYGSTTNLLIGNEVLNNSFEQTYYFGVYFYYTDLSVINNNNIDLTSRGNLQADGFYGFVTSNLEFKGNYIHAPDWGFYLSNGNAIAATPSKKVSFINNMIISDSDYGVYLYSVDSVDFIHNSILSSGSSQPTLLIGQNNAFPIDNYDMRNNIFSAGAAEAFETITIADTAFVDKFNNNLFYSTGTTLINIVGNAYPNLAAYQLANPLFNNASLDGNPQFASSSNLHIVGSFVNDNGDNSVNVLTDIDGDVRPSPSATTVDIGADEFDPPTCPPVTSFSTVVIGGDSIDLNWTGGAMGVTYQYSVVLRGQAPNTGVINAITPLTAVGVGGLNSGTDYSSYVRIICTRGDTSIWIGPDDFTTPCLTPSPIVLPYLQDFETISGTLVGNGVVSCNSTANWNLETTSQSDGRVLYGTNAIGTFTGNGHATLDEVANNTPANRLILTLNMSNYTTVGTRLLFDYFDHGDETTRGDSVWIRGSISDPWVGVYALDPSSTTNGVIYSVGPIDIDQALTARGQTVSSTFQVAFGQEDNSPATTQTGIDGISFDNIQVIEDPTCPEPSLLSATNITFTTVDLDWVENGTATQWEIAYGVAGSGVGSATIVNTTTKPYALTGLVSSTAYEFYVRSICAVGDTSTWSILEIFSMANGIPFVEDFETFTPNVVTGPFPRGWTATSGTNHTWQSELSNNGQNANSVGTGPLWDHTFFGGPTNGIYMYMETSSSTLGDSVDLISPTVFVGNNASIDLEYWYFNFGLNIDRMKVLIDTNGTEDLIATYNGQQQTVQTMPWLFATHSLTGYQGKSIKVIFRGYGVSCCSGDISIDDVRISSTAVGLENVQSLVNSLNIFPNPSKGLFTLQLKSEKIENLNLSIRDLNGKEVYKSNISVNGTYKENIDLTFLAKGVYFMQVMSGKESRVEKIVIQ